MRVVMMSFPSFMGRDEATHGFPSTSLSRFWGLASPTLSARFGCEKLRTRSIEYWTSVILVFKQGYAKTVQLIGGSSYHCSIATLSYILYHWSSTMIMHERMSGYDDHWHSYSRVAIATPATYIVFNTYYLYIYILYIVYYNYKY